jgi:predicted ATPase
MSYISEIKISKKAQDRLKKLAGRAIKFLPGINFLIGENGIGKSSILSELVYKDPFAGFMENRVKKEKEIKKTLTGPGTLRLHYFDTEKMNPRIVSSISSPFDVHSRFMSHGECLIMVLKAFKTGIKSKEESHLLLIDEPEGGLSPWKQKELLDIYIKYSKKVLIIIATHSLIFTGSKVGRLIELTEKKINYFDPPCSYDWKI